MTLSPVLAYKHPAGASRWEWIFVPRQILQKLRGLAPARLWEFAGLGKPDLPAGRSLATDIYIFLLVSLAVTAVITLLLLSKLRRIWGGASPDPGLEL